jgi:elongation factor Ts
MEISAATVKAFRDKTGLPMMDCKKALVEANGDEDKAIEILRKSGAKTMEARTDRETSAGRIALFVDTKKNVSAMVELLCESAPVANTEEFIALVNGLAEQLATGPGAKTPDELLAQPFPGKPGMTLKQFYDDLVNKIREVFRLTRIVRIEGPCGAYVHHNAGIGVFVPIEGEGSNDSGELGKGIAMHVASMKPQALSENDLDPAMVKRERDLIVTQVQEQSKGKPENVIQKIVDGKMSRSEEHTSELQSPK